MLRANFHSHFARYIHIFSSGRTDEDLMDNDLSDNEARPFDMSALKTRAFVLTQRYSCDQFIRTTFQPLNHVKMGIMTAFHGCLIQQISGHVFLFLWKARDTSSRAAKSCLEWQIQYCSGNTRYIQYSACNYSSSAFI